MQSVRDESGPYRRAERVATLIAIAALIASTVVLIWAAIPNMSYARELNQRGTPEARYMSFGWWLASGVLLTCAAVIASLAILAAASRSERPTVLLLAGAIISPIGVWAVASDFGGEFGIALRATVVAGLCALVASIVLNWLRFRGHSETAATGEPDWPDFRG
jgi:hypothetical protein